MRSTFVYSLVDVDNLSFEPPDAYHRTQRATGNLVWSPIARFDLGTEILWGQRENKDGNAAEAMQLQLAATYRF